mmetsp:Transcript_98524/g.175501  ORF Transcript_98524/g.175501 Transcript_98524/m.175501 type:complete len:924 (-) Transcript_98524:61-2832(-)
MACDWQMLTTTALLLMLALSYRMIPYFVVLGLAAQHCYCHAMDRLRIALSLSCIAVTWFCIIRFMINYDGAMNAFDAAYADVIWGGHDGNWAYTQTLLCWAVVATLWSSDGSIFYTLFGVLGAMSGSYLLYTPESKPSSKVSLSYAVCSVLAFMSIIMLPLMTTAESLGWCLWLLHVSIIAPKLISMLVPLPQIDRCVLYAALALASLVVHFSAGKAAVPNSDCRISITVDAVVCALLTLHFVFQRSSVALTCLWALLLVLLSPGFVLASFCALEQGLWPRLVTIMQCKVAELLRAKDSDSDRDGKWEKSSWMNLGHWKETKHYDTACRQLATAVADAASLDNKSRLLCVACGRGDELLFLQRKYEVERVSGLDRQPVSIAKSCEFARQGTRLVCGEAGDMFDGEQLFCPGEFNRIIVVDGIYHLDKSQFFRDSVHLLSDGGYVAVSDVIVHAETPYWIRLLLVLMGIPMCNQWSKESYETNLASAGLSPKIASLEPFVLAHWLPKFLLRNLDYVVISASVPKARKRPKAAVVGSGLSGLAAARLLASTHEVTVFEGKKEPGFAGLEAKMASGEVVDIPLRMIEFNYWKSVVALCKKLGVPLVSTNFTVNIFGYGSEKLVNTAREQQLSNIFGNLRWYAGLLLAALQLGFRNALDGESLGHFAQRLGLQKSDFYLGVRRHFSWILSCPYELVDNYPLELIKGFYLAILGNFWQSANPTVRIFPSARGLQETLLVGREIRSGCPVSPFVESKTIHGEEFDVVVIATEANVVHKILPREWAEVFNEFEYHPSHVFVHRDTSLMPGRREDWRAVNVCDDSEGKACQISVWVNAYYDGIDFGGDVFETVNATHRPKDELIVKECHMQRCVHNQDSKKLQAKIAALQGREGFYFCGAYSVEGLGLLEQAVHSAKCAVDAVLRDSAQQK